MSDVQSTVEYRDIQGFPGYRVGNDGSVWTRLKFVGIGRPSSGFLVVIGNTWRRLATNKNKRYPDVLLHPGRKCVTVHKLVLEAFVGPRPTGMQACHEDDNGRNNTLSNLRWDTKESNEADKRRNGGHRVGSAHYKAKLTEAQALEIKTSLAQGVKPPVLAKKFGVSRDIIYGIQRGKTWKHLLKKDEHDEDQEKDKPNPAHAG